MKRAYALWSGIAGLVAMLTVFLVMMYVRQAVMPDVIEVPDTSSSLTADQSCESFERYALSSQGVQLVGELQRSLAARGYYRAALDGCSGVQTQQAIYRYQRDHDLAATGGLNAPTLTHLGIALPVWFVEGRPAIPAMAQDPAPQPLRSTP